MGKQTVTKLDEESFFTFQCFFQWVNTELYLILFCIKLCLGNVLKGLILHQYWIGKRSEQVFPTSNMCDPLLERAVCHLSDSEIHVVIE